MSLAVSGGPEEVRVDPGGQGVTSFTVRGPSDRAQPVEIEVTGLRTGEGAYHFEDAPTGGLSVDVSPSTFTLAPGGAQEDKVEVVAAADAEPGGAYAGIVVRGLPDAEPGSTPVVGEIGVPLLVVVSGDVRDEGHIARFRGSRSPASPESVTFEIDHANTGNVHHPVAGRIQLRDGDRSLGEIQVEPVPVLPGTTRTVSVAWPDPVPPGPLTATLSLSWGRDAQHQGTRETQVPAAGAQLGDTEEDEDSSGISARVVPATIAGLLVLLLLLLLLLAFRRRAATGDTPREWPSTSHR